MMERKSYTVREIGSLASEVQNGSKDAVEKLYEAVRPSMTKLAYKSLSSDRRNKENAEDIFQDTFLKCLKSLDQLREPSLFVKWFSTSIAHTACTWNRRNNGISMEEMETDEDGDHRSSLDQKMFDMAEEDSSLKEEIEVMKECLKKIRPEYAEMLRMFYLEGYSYAEISERTGMKVSTVVGRIQTARKELKEEMTNFLNEK